MQSYLQHLAVPKICFIENTMLSIKPIKIKQLQLILQEIMAKAKIYGYRKINELGQPITITEYRSDEKSVQKFTYKDDILTNIQTL